ncbi:hypothetical protein CALCODRAFT_489102 [Calocera cornea HHB12733]|uniref:Uncharacterized protein n=1 Tax=Calocera cornea HHB12733 TaxID=1353952 RepID=A0A166LBM8_9BASI|nr:hypothetical protein CALCODRAFT_489102 [Calocera cornea HHB12733]
MSYPSNGEQPTLEPITIPLTLEQQVQVLLAKVNRLREAETARLANSTPIQVTIPTNNGPKGSKMATPDVFDGTRAKTLTFVRQLKLYTTARPKLLVNGQTKL